MTDPARILGGQPHTTGRAQRQAGEVRVRDPHRLHEQRLSNELCSFKVGLFHSWAPSVAMTQRKPTSSQRKLGP
jgi:hypothetical protein